MAYYVYLLASKKHGTLYLGVTRDLVRRVYEHRTKAVESFTSRYGVDKLVWFEIYDDAATAIAREKELKKWRRDWKIRLIEEQNPGWVDLLSWHISLVSRQRRHSGATRSGEPGIHNHGLGLWIPGPRQEARPGMTAELWAQPVHFWRFAATSHGYW